MDTEIDLVATARLLLLQHVRLVLVIQKLDDGLPGIAVVDVVAESRSVNDGQTDWILLGNDKAGREGLATHP